VTIATATTTHTGKPSANKMGGCVSGTLGTSSFPEGTRCP
jgi:hypothetical protein